MTFREKLKMEHPESIDKDCAGGCRCCPGTYGYETFKECPENHSCTECWDREIPNIMTIRKDIEDGEIIKLDETANTNLTKDELLAQLLRKQEEIDSLNVACKGYEKIISEYKAENEKLKKSNFDLNIANEVLIDKYFFMKKMKGL